MITDYKKPLIQFIIKPKVGTQVEWWLEEGFCYLERYISSPETTVIIVGTKQKGQGKKY
jgi:hypothetical protein